MAIFRQFEEFQTPVSEQSVTNGESIIAFMPIKPIYAERIVKGRKKFEFRRASINSKLTHLIVYASYPVKQIIAVAVVSGVRVSSPWATWNEAKTEAGISRRAFRGYFQGKKKAIAIQIKKVLPLNRRLRPCEVIDNFKIPQSFKYVDKEFLRIVFEKGVMWGLEAE
jgi:predicted transcriptional regulator